MRESHEISFTFYQMDKEKIPAHWDQTDLKRSRQLSLNFDIWNYDSNLFGLRRIKSDFSIKSIEGSEPLKESVFNVRTGYENHTDSTMYKAKKCDPFVYVDPTIEKVSTVPVMMDNYQMDQLSYPNINAAPFNMYSRLSNDAIRKGQKMDDPCIHEKNDPFMNATKPVPFYSTVAKTRSSEDYKDEKEDIKKQATKKRNPIGIFVWGFPFEYKVNNIFNYFSTFGDILQSKCALI
jgi:hypothetical protein